MDQSKCETYMKSEIPIDFLNDPRTVKFYGQAFKLKTETLTALLRKEPLARVATRHSVTRHAIYRHARLARKIFGDISSPVD